MPEKPEEPLREKITPVEKFAPKIGRQPKLVPAPIPRERPSEIYKLCPKEPEWGEAPITAELKTSPTTPKSRQFSWIGCPAKEEEPQITRLVAKPKEVEFEPSRVEMRVREVPIESIREEFEEERKEYEELAKLDFLEFFFGEGASAIRGAKACVLVLPGWEKFAEIVCTEAYREKVGGDPDEKICSLEELSRVEPFEHPVKDSLVILDEKIGTVKEELRGLLEGFHSFRAGFLIAPSDDPFSLSNEIREMATGAPVAVCPSKPLWGSPNEFFKETIIALDRRLEEYPEHLKFKTPEIPLFKQWDKLQATGESPLAAGMKAFIWMKKWEENKRLEPELEKEIDGYRVDVYSPSTEEIYEAETCRGIGGVWGKLTEKARELGRKYRVRYVLRPLSVFLHLRELLEFRKAWIKEGRDLEIYAIDIDGKKLKPIMELARELRDQIPKSSSWGRGVEIES